MRFLNFLNKLKSSDVSMGIIIKSSEQIEKIRESSILAAKTLNYVEPFIKEGVSTEFLDQKIHQFITENNATPAPLNYNGFPKSSCISLNNVVCHGIPSKNTLLKNGDILNVDITTNLNGYYGDTSRMFTVGKIPEPTQQLLDVTKKCLNIGIEQSYPGNRLSNIGYYINQYARSKGYSVVYEFCGHGVGLKFHEPPEVSHVSEKNTGAELKPGMIFTIEPMINAGKARVKVDKNDGWTARTIDGELSAQYEHTILITETGNEVLTDLNGEYKTR